MALGSDNSILEIGVTTDDLSQLKENHPRRAFIYKFVVIDEFSNTSEAMKKRDLLNDSIQPSMLHMC